MQYCFGHEKSNVHVNIYDMVYIEMVVVDNNTL